MDRSTTKAEVKESQIRLFMLRTNTSRSTAVAYLEAEEWDLTDALISYRGDNAK